MSFGDYLHRKADDSTHNEILAFLTVILGAVILMGGFLVTFIVAEQPKWFILFPYQLSSQPSSVLGLILALTGFLLISTGFIMIIYYDRRKEWCLSQIEETNPYKNSARKRLKLERIKNLVEESKPN
jgi:hypothetical protein